MKELFDLNSSYLILAPAKLQSNPLRTDVKDRCSCASAIESVRLCRFTSVFKHHPAPSFTFGTLSNIYTTKRSRRRLSY